MKIDDLFISIIDEALTDKLFTQTIDFNIELALFSVPRVLEDRRLAYIINKVKSVLRAAPRKTLHGPVVDLYYDSRDSKVRDIAWQRTLQGLKICKKLEAEIMVAHSSFNPLFRASEKYPRGWVKRSIEFWRKMSVEAAARNVTVVFENIFDSDPALIKEVIEGVNMPSFKACIDTGHLNIFSSATTEEWVRVLGKDLVYLHVHNNYGVIDEHNGLQDGTFDFAAFFEALKNNNIEPDISLEIRRIEDIEPSKKILVQLMK